MSTIFVVDDSRFILDVIKAVLGTEHNVITMTSAEKMFKHLEVATPDVIILDVEMPKMSGFEAIKLLKEYDAYKNIPVLFLTGEVGEAQEAKGFELGAVDYIHKTLSLSGIVHRVNIWLGTGNVIKDSLLQIRKTQEAIITVLASTVANRDKITGKHIERTQAYLKVLVDGLVKRRVYAQEMSGWDICVLVPSAQLHDVGKISVSDAILNKPGKLLDEEFRIIQSHCLEGERIINEIIEKAEMKSDFFEYAKHFAVAHHERWDGHGYPRHLKGEDIPLESRILAVCDVYDALVSERPYKRSFSHKEAVTIIEGEIGTHFDPKIGEVFLRVAQVFQQV